MHFSLPNTQFLTQGDSAPLQVPWPGGQLLDPHEHLT